MPKVGRAIACLIMFAGSVGGLCADEQPSIGPGTRVRLRSSGAKSLKLVGVLTAADRSSLTVVPEDGGEAKAVPRQDIVRLERSVSPSRKSRGVWIGFGVGLALAFGKAAIQGGCNDGCDSSNILAAGLVAVSTATAGGLIASGERWSDVVVERVQSHAMTAGEAGLRVRLVPQVMGGVGLSLVASF